MFFLDGQNNQDDCVCVCVCLALGYANFYVQIGSGCKALAQWLAVCRAILGCIGPTLGDNLGTLGVTV